MDKKETEYFELYVHFAILPKIPPQGDEKKYSRISEMHN